MSSSRRIVVTGSRGLIGSAVANYLDAQGHEIIELDLSLGHDLTDENFVRDWFARNPVDGLVNMFALNDHVDSSFGGTTFLDVSLESFARYMDVNITALFSVCREFIRSNAEGSIVNASSIYGEVSPRPSLYGGGQKHPGYGVSKAGVSMLTRYLAVHAAPNHRVNCLVIGGIENRQDAAFVERYSQAAPLGRMGLPSDIPPLVEFLLSKQSAYMTGSLVPIDGGWTA